MVRKITPELIQEITRRIRDSLPAEKIILFGSYARGNPGPDSDLDLFIVVPDSDQPGYRRARGVYRSLRGVGVPVDVIVQTREEVRRGRQVPTSLVSRVFAEGKVLHG